MIIKSEKKVVIGMYDSVLDFEIDYLEEYNLFRCCVYYGGGHGSVAFVRPAIGFYVMKRLQAIDKNRKCWIDTDRLLWTTINNLNWIN